MVTPPSRQDAASKDGVGRRSAIQRSDYLIDRFRVRHEFGDGWTCSCADFLAHDACKHTREAAGRRAAQTQIAEHLKADSRESFSIRTRAHGR